jgi:hypothetical protein
MGLSISIRSRSTVPLPGSVIHWQLNLRDHHPQPLGPNTYFSEVRQISTGKFPARGSTR